MKFTLSWLKDHLDTTATVAEIAERLTALGLEVEEVIDRTAELAPFTVAHVKSAEPHPNADKLRVCVLDTADGEIQVVCGAPNARGGMMGVYAPVGTHIPGTGLDLKPGVIRGVQSNGMLCSEREMGLSDNHTGIIDLADYKEAARAAVGQSFAALMGFDDPVIHVAITPDRADCTGVRGIARDLAAAGVGTLKPARPPAVPGTFKSPIGVEILDEAATACPLFVGRHIRGLKNGPSPAWLQRRLLAVGLRPISALVDITNFFTLDRARPLHVFDVHKLSGGIVVRLSRPGEEVAALNDRTYTLADGMTVIADHDAALGLGGIIGGEPSSVTDETTDVFLEAALFDPVRTAATGRRLGIESDARYRFERGVDPDAVLRGAEAATRMILELCGGEPSELVIAGRVPDWKRTVALRASRVKTLGGVELPVDRQAGILMALGFKLAESEDRVLRVEVPSWRGDIAGEADLVEEVLRVHGYDRIAAEPLTRTVTVTRPALDAQQRRTAQVRRTLAALGLDEAVTWSFLAEPVAQAFGGGHPGLRLVNPIAANLTVMRPSILPNLIEAAERNRARGFPDVCLFEVGPVYRDATEKGQETVATALRAGPGGRRHWAEAPRPADVFDAKADALAVLEAAGAPVANLQVTTDAPAWYHPGRSGVLRLGPTVLAQFGELHPALLKTLDATGPAAACEVFLNRVPPPKAKKDGAARAPLKLSPFQPLDRDFAFIVDADTPADRLIRAARGADKALIADVTVFDVFTGDAIGQGRKSVALTVTLQPTEATLTDEAIEAIAQKIVANVAKQTGAVLRG
ncbi:MAG: phenylalanine--tRNA ligase subunit beta [Rhodospirillaceae bacterium]|nr:phenylalanine--tRNA ligase subunit beta [Rhodospirillaceae bacterium]